MKLKFLIGSIFFALVMVSAVADINRSAALWREEPSMWTTPKTYEINESNSDGVKSVVIEGEVYKGVRTRFFAWWALPK